MGEETLIDKIEQIRARHNHIKETWWAPDDPCFNQAHDDRGYLLAEVERQALYIEYLQEKIDAVHTALRGKP